MPYIARDYSSLLGLPGLSDNLLSNHFTLYQGYVANINKLDDLLKTFKIENKIGTPEYAEIKRRFGWEWNGMRLHELYFENLQKSSATIVGLVRKIIELEFGSVEAWEKDFRATSAMRGIGWTILYYDENADRLFNQWIGEHDTAHMAGLKPLLIMDVFEHAFMLDYGLKRADYIETFMSHINWEAVNNRL